MKVEQKVHIRGWGGEGYSIFMHGRSCMTIDIRPSSIPTMPGRSMSG